MTQTLALLGGNPVRSKLFPAYRIIGAEEKAAVSAVIDSGILSRFLGSWHPDFYGGPVVQAFEREWADTFGIRHALSVNSCTSGLYAAIGAAGVGPGDEVIVPPLSMAATATAPLIFNAVPVFADIDPVTYCLDPESVLQAITPRTKAIMVVHLFGQPADMDAIMAIAHEHSLIVIEDCAQAPFAMDRGRFVGGLGHMGVFSFNYHKHIHTGEGGMVTTNDDTLAERVRLVRNHAEAVVGPAGVANLVNMLGFNFRLGEIEAAIGRCQLSKGPLLIEQRLENVAYLESRLGNLPGLSPSKVRDGAKHVYYLHAFDYDQMVTGVSRELLVDAIAAELPATELREAEGKLIYAGYAKPLYLLPMYQTLTGYGDKACPFRCPHYTGTVDYTPDSYPQAQAATERMITHELMRPFMKQADLDDVIGAFHKVFSQLGALQDHASRRSKVQ